MLSAQNVIFSADLTPPSASVVGPQVTTGPGASAVNLGSVLVCPAAAPQASCSETQVLAYTLHFTGTLGPTKVVTDGISGLDYTLNYSSCTGPQEPGVTCLVGITFAPLAPGLRRGAVEITDSNSFPITTTLLYGSGTAPETGFSPPTESNITTGINQPSGVAVNAQGDVFYTDSVAGTLLKVPYNARLSQTVLDSGFSNPSGVALDGAGNIYVADTGHNVVLKVPPGGGPGVPIGQSLTAPSGLAVDGQGDVFVSLPSLNYVVEVPITGAAIHTVGGGFLNPTGIALDSSGNLFVADTGNNRVMVVPSNTSTPQLPVGNGFSAPLSVAVDAAGDVFIGVTNSDGIVEVPADGSLAFTIGNGFIRPTGMALGPDGNLYIADLSRAEVVQLLRASGPNFTFATTQVNSISSDSPQWVNVENIGNSPLQIDQTPVTIDPDFVLVHGPTAQPYCTGGITVAPGSSCVLSFSFQPMSVGTFTTAYVLQDNNLNSLYNQNIGLSGTSTGITPKIQPGLPPSAYYGSTFQIIPYSNSPGAFTFALVSGPASVLTSGLVTVTGEGLVTISETQAASGNYLATTVYASFQATRAGTTISLTAVPVKSGFGTAATVTVTVHSDTSGLPTGTVIVFDGSTVIGRPTLVNGMATITTSQLSPGTHIFSASYPGDNNFDVSVTGGQSLVVASSTVTLTAADTTIKSSKPVVLTVSVTQTLKQEPHGKIVILDGTTQVDSARLRAGDDGTLGPLQLKLAAGVHTLTAVYDGDPKYSPGVSAPLVVTVK